MRVGGGGSVMSIFMHESGPATYIQSSGGTGGPATLGNLVSNYPQQTVALGIDTLRL